MNDYLYHANHSIPSCWCHDFRNAFRDTGPFWAESTGRASNAYLWYIPRFKQAVQQTVEFLPILDAMTLMWRHCYDVANYLILSFTGHKVVIMFRSKIPRSSSINRVWLKLRHGSRSSFSVITHLHHKLNGLPQWMVYWLHPVVICICNYLPMVVISCVNLYKHKISMP